jgi:hypothetical protein
MGVKLGLLTLREEQRIRLFENRVLRRIFGPRRDEVVRGRRKLHNEELRHLYSLQSLIRMMKPMRITWVPNAARMGKKRNTYRIFVGKTEG